MMYHYLYAPSRNGSPMRVLTNKVKPHVEKAYIKSKFTNKVVSLKPESDNSPILVALNTGSWDFPLLQHRAIEQGVDFRIVSYDMKTVATWDEDYLKQAVSMSNFGYASADNLVLVKFHGHSGFDLEPLGIRISNHRKLVKRLTELLRCSGHYVYDPLAEVTHQEFVTPKGEDDTTYDGMNYMRKSLARKLGFKFMRGNVRFITELGLIKGDVIVVDDDQIEADFVYHTENLKSEFRSDGWQLITIMKHGDVKEIGHNDQIRFNFPTLITNKVIAGDLSSFVNGWKKSLEEGGDLHNYLTSQQTAFDDPIAIDLARVTSASRLEEQAELLNEVGIPPAMFSNIPYTRTGAMVRRCRTHQMRNSEKQPIPYFKKTYIPTRNAFAAAVVTFGSLTKMGNFDFSYMGEDGTRTFFLPGVGLVVPDSRFRDTYELHGGDDLDDTWNGYKKKFFCSDPAKLEMLIQHKVLDPSLNIPSTKEEATDEAALFIRMPNGPGEYSIERVSPDLPWCLSDEDAVETIDLANAPLPHDLAFAGATFEELEASVDYRAEYDAEFALNAIQAQTINPNVGPFANAIMAAAATFGPDSIPSSMITLRMEEAIDTVQQEADAHKFRVINDAVASMWIEFLDHVVTNKIKVDIGLLITRVPEEVRIADEKVFIGRRIKELGLVKGGITHLLHKEYNRRLTEMSDMAKAAPMKARNELELTQKLAKARIPENLMVFARDWIIGCNVALRKLDEKYSIDELDNDSPLSTLMKRHLQEEKRRAMEAEMDRWVSQIVLNDRHDTHKQIIALYKWIVTPREGYPMGDIDRVFVQPSSPGAVSMLKLFIAMMTKYGMTNGSRIASPKS